MCAITSVENARLYDYFLLECVQFFTYANAYNIISLWSCFYAKMGEKWQVRPSDNSKITKLGIDSIFDNCIHGCHLSVREYAVSYFVIITSPVSEARGIIIWFCINVVLVLSGMLNLP